MRRNGWLAACLAIVLGGTGVAPVPAAAGLVEPAASVQRAIDEYAAAMETQDRYARRERFARAEQLFRQTIEGGAGRSGVHNAALYVNLGNAALQAEHLGPAIAAYRRALALDPQHGQARQNLDYARTLLPEWARHAEASHLIDSLFFWRTLVPPGRLLVFGAGCFLVAAALAAAGYARRRPLVRNSAVIPLLAWLVLNMSLLVGNDRNGGCDIVVVTEATVYAADSENSAPRLARPLPSGTELSLMGQRAQWSEIRLPDGRSGWVLTSAVDRL